MKLPNEARCIISCICVSGSGGGGGKRGKRRALRPSIVPTTAKAYLDGLQIAVGEGHDVPAQTCRECKAAARVGGEEGECYERKSQRGNEHVAAARDARRRVSEERQAFVGHNSAQHLNRRGGGFNGGGSSSSSGSGGGSGGRKWSNGTHQGSARACKRGVHNRKAVVKILGDAVDDEEAM